jgi:hypothetical protein
MDYDEAMKMNYYSVQTSDSLSQQPTNRAFDRARTWPIFFKKMFGSKPKEGFTSSFYPLNEV